MHGPCDKDRLIGGVLILTLAVLVGVGLWKTRGGRAPEWIAVVRSPRGVMGTDCRLAVVVRPGEQTRAHELLDAAEKSLRESEARLSRWLADSEIGRLNTAEAGSLVPLSPETLEVLRLARKAFEETDGAFDATCRPRIQLWRECARRGTLPTEAELATARAASHWDLIELTDTGAIKRGDGARVDLGGLAKGWAIDRAVDLLRASDAVGGQVDVGGDLVCFGRPPTDDAWPVDVKDPKGPGRMARLELLGGAVCTSGGYARFVEIEGRRYSHIIDPRTGRPAAAAISVTVVAPDAATADVWATALSVLGPEGLGRLPNGVEAMVVGTPGVHQTQSTPGFRPLLERSE